MSKTIQQKLNEGREYRDLMLAIVETPDEEYKVEGFATTYDKPYHLYNMQEDDGYTYEVQEQVLRSAFDSTDLDDVIMQYNHEGRVFARTSNETLKLDKDNDEGLFISADLGGTTIGRQLFEEIKGGYTTKMSFGFTVKDDAFERVEQNDKGEVWLRTIKGIGKVYDVSAVSLPANDMTSISARAFCDGVIKEAEAERLQAKEEERRALEREQKKAELVERIKALKGEKNEH